MNKRIDVDITDIAIIAEKHEREEFTFECRSREYDGFVYFMEGEGTLYISGTTFSLPVFPGALFWFHRGDSYRFRVEAGCHYVTSAYRLVRDDASIVPLLPTMTMAEGAGELAVNGVLHDDVHHGAALVYDGVQFPLHVLPAVAAGQRVGDAVGVRGQNVPPGGGGDVQSARAKQGDVSHDDLPADGKLPGQHRGAHRPLCLLQPGGDGLSSPLGVHKTSPFCLS